MNDYQSVLQMIRDGAERALDNLAAGSQVTVRGPDGEAMARIEGK